MVVNTNFCNSLILVILSGLNINLALAERNIFLSSPRLTDLGDWGEWDECPEKTYVMGMRLKTEPAQGNLNTFNHLLSKVPSLYVQLLLKVTRCQSCNYDIEFYTL